MASIANLYPLQGSTHGQSHDVEETGFLSEIIKVNQHQKGERWQHLLKAKIVMIRLG